MPDYKEMDQSSWVCYELSDKSYYYGEVGYLDESGVVHPKDTPDAANNPSLKLVKHGYGVYLYKGEEGSQSRYEGNWNRDQKQGQGKLIIKDHFEYEGSFKDGAYHEQGKMTWSNGDVYDGNWKKGRMEGGGIFKHHEGFVLKGSFRANYFIDDKILRNPQMGDKEYTLFKKQRKEVIKQKQRNQKVIHGFVSKVKSEEQDKIVELIVKSNTNNRVPLILASQGSKVNLNSLQEVLSKDRKVHSFDLRKAYTLKGQQRYHYKEDFGAMTRSTIGQGGALLINLDESQVAYQEAFYPDLKEFYDSAGFNTTTWSRDQVKRKEVHSKLGVEDVNDSYVLGVWSKVKLNEDLKEERIREKLQLRFETILPFIKMDIIFVVSSPPPPQPQPEAAPES